MRIMGVAIKHGDMVMGLPRPYRHHHTLKYMIDTLGIEAPVGHQYEDGQGFYLEDGTYLNREQAREFAMSGAVRINGEKVVNTGVILDTCDHARELFSEDLW